MVRSSATRTLYQPGEFLASRSCTYIRVSIPTTQKQLVMLILLWLWTAPRPDVRKCSFPFLFLLTFFSPGTLLTYRLLAKPTHKDLLPYPRLVKPSLKPDLLSGLSRHPSPSRLQSFQHAYQEPAMLCALLSPPDLPLTSPGC